MRTVRIEPKGTTAILRLDKARGNAIDGEMVEDLIEAARRLDRDPAVRGILLASSHPKLFCPGLDLIGLLDVDRDALARFMTRFGEAVWALYALGKPVVAALSGHAVAGGCVLALTADYRILQRGGASVGLNEIRVGVPLPWSVALLLAASVRPERLAETALLGRNFADEEAVAVGFAHELAPPEGFESSCLKRLQEFAEKDPVALATTKKHLRSRVLAEMRAGEAGRISEFVDAWFSEPTQARIREAVDKLGKPRPG